MPFDCIIFDLDGTLVDSERLCSQALLDLVPELNTPLDQMVSRYQGLQMDLILEDVESRLERGLGSGFIEEYREHLGRLMDQQLQPMPGVEQVLESLEQPVCVGSNAPLAKIEHSLAVTGLSRFFGDRLFSAYEVGVWKPEPGLFLHAAEQMGVGPERCAVIEDSPAGTQGGLNAGMCVFQFLPRRQKDAVEGATHFSRMDALPALLA